MVRCAYQETTVFDYQLVTGIPSLLGTMGKLPLPYLERNFLPQNQTENAGLRPVFFGHVALQGTASRIYTLDVVFLLGPHHPSVPCGDQRGNMSPSSNFCLNGPIVFKLSRSGV